MELARTVHQLGIPRPAIYLTGAVAALGAVVILIGMRYCPNNRLEVVERLWSLRGSFSEGRLMAFGGRAGGQSMVVHGATYFLLCLLCVWQCRIHSAPLILVSQDAILATVAPRLYAGLLTLPRLPQSCQPRTPPQWFSDGGRSGDGS